MHKTYKTSGTCSVQIDYDIENNKIYNLQFTGGCNGNLKGIAALIEGKDVEEVKERLKGITCNHKQTSCPDQLARSLEEI